MSGLAEIIRTEDWKKEKHVPVIEIISEIKKGEPILVKVTVGKEIPHPNTTEHHIRWIRLLFLPEGSKIPYDVGFAEFTAHGESTQGPNKGPVYTEPVALFSLKLDKPGKLIALSYCNIHGIWASEREITL